MPGFNLVESYVPETWKSALQEKSKAAVSIINSAIVAPIEDLKAVAEGPGVGVEMPFFRDISEQLDAIQVERTAPAIQSLGTGKQMIKKLMRVIANDATAETRNLGHQDPLAAFLNRRALRRLANSQAKLVSILNGCFGTALSANSVDRFSETLNSNVDNFWNENYFFDAAASLGVLQRDIEGGAILVHSVVYAAMQKADAITFVKPSEGAAFLATWKGLPVYIDDSLVRNGTTSGKVYSSYIVSAGAFGHGMADQPFLDLGATFNPSTSHFAIEGDPSLNVLTIYDRTAECLHLDGMSYTGAVAGGSPTNAELATAGSWTLAYSSANKVGAVRVRTNG